MGPNLKEKGFAEAVARPVTGDQAQEAEYAQCESGQTLSEWCRQVLHEAAAGSAQAPNAEVILSEILGLRRIMFNLVHGELTGEPVSEEHARLCLKLCPCRSDSGQSGAEPLLRLQCLSGLECPRKAPRSDSKSRALQWA